MRKFFIIIFSGVSIMLIAISVVYYNAQKKQDISEQKAVASTGKEGLVSKPLSQSEIFNFVSDYVKSLSYFKTAQTKVEQVHKNANNYKDDIEMGASFMNSFKLANKDLTTAQSLLEKHKNSKNQYIQKAITTTEIAYNRLIQLNDISADLLTKQMDKQGHFNLGKYMGQMRTVFVEKDGLLQALMYASTLVAKALVDENPDENGQLTYLVLTAKEREKLLNAIDKTFGEAAREFKESMLYTDAPAAALRHILAGRHRSADER